MLQYRGVDFSVSVVHYNHGPTNQIVGACYNTVVLTSVSVVHYNDGPTNQFIGPCYNTVVLTLVLLWFI